MATINEITLVKAEELPITETPEEGMVIFAEGNDLKRFPTTFITDQVAQISGGWKGNITPFMLVTADGIYTPIQAGTYTGGLVYDPEGDDVGYLVQFVKSNGSWFKRRTKLALPEDMITAEVDTQVYGEITF
ncbi:MAG: hypothetical protein ACTHY1_03430 [Lactobacillus helveticus]